MNGVSLSVSDAQTFTPNTFTGIPKLELSIEKSKPYDLFIYVGVYSDELYTGKVGVAKGLVIVCGQEIIKRKNDDVIELKLLYSENKISKYLSEIFEIDITGTMQ